METLAGEIAIPHIKAPLYYAELFICTFVPCRAVHLHLALQSVINPDT